jgi:hypothetical protein
MVSEAGCGVLKSPRRLPDNDDMGFVESHVTTYPRGANPTLTGTWAPRVVTAALLLLATFLVWRELEPNLLFRPVDGVVVGSRFGTYVIRPGLSRLIEVNYIYKVNGRSYFSNKWRRTYLSMRPWIANPGGSRYAAGARVQVWYNPQNPADSVLSRSTHPGIFLIFGLSAIMTAWIWLRYSRSRA